jgi:hypothetical protein
MSNPPFFFSYTVSPPFFRLEIPSFPRKICKRHHLLVPAQLGRQELHRPAIALNRQQRQTFVVLQLFTGKASEQRRKLGEMARVEKTDMTQCDFTTVLSGVDL